MKSIMHKLTYAEKPEMRITDNVSVKVNNAALAVLEANEALQSGAISKGIDSLFSAEDKAKLLGINGLTFEDLITVLKEAIQLCIGEEKN